MVLNFVLVYAEVLGCIKLESFGGVLIDQREDVRFCGVVGFGVGAVVEE